MALGGMASCGGQPGWSHAEVLWEVSVLSLREWEALAVEEWSSGVQVGPLSILH